MSVLIAPTSNRHPSESWGIPVATRSNSPAKTPASAGVTAVIDTTDAWS
jgi:hypothetical protein